MIILNRKIRRRKEALNAKLEKERLVKALQDMKNHKDDLRRNSNCTLSLSVKVLSNYLHLQAHCDKLKAFRIAQFFQNSKIQKITVKKIFFRNSDDGFLLIGVFQVYIRSFKAKLAETKIWIFPESNPTITITRTRSSS